MSRIPTVVTLLRSPERAAIAALDAAAAITRTALLAAHPQLQSEPTGDPLDRSVRRLMRRLDSLLAALDAYVRIDDVWEPSDRTPF